MKKKASIRLGTNKVSARGQRRNAIGCFSTCPRLILYDSIGRLFTPILGGHVEKTRGIPRPTLFSMG